MIEHYSVSETRYPAEGRNDIAADLDEQRLAAYSAQHVRVAASGRTTTPQAHSWLDKFAPEPCYPAEGRSDIATDLEDEQRQAYSARQGKVH